MECQEDGVEFTLRACTTVRLRNAGGETQLATKLPARRGVKEPRPGGASQGPGGLVSEPRAEIELEDEPGSRRPGSPGCRSPSREVRPTSPLVGRALSRLFEVEVR